eukprot:CFRG0681T1
MGLSHDVVINASANQALLRCCTLRKTMAGQGTGGYAWARKHLREDVDADMRYERRISERTNLLQGNNQAWGGVVVAGGVGNIGDERVNGFSVRALPVEDRHRRCHDRPSLLVFIGLWLLVLGSSLMGASHSQYQKLTYGTDIDGNTCGINNVKFDTSLQDASKMPFLFFFPENQAQRRCVLACPTKTNAADIVDPSTFVCIPGLHSRINTTASLHQAIKLGQCSSGVFASRSFLHRCRPTLTGDSYINPINNQSVTTSLSELAMYAEIDTYGVSVRVLADMASSLHWILWCAVFSCVCAYGWIYAMKKAVSHLMWVMIVGSILVMVAVTVKCFVMYITHSTSGPFHTQAATTNQRIILAMSLISTFITGVAITVVVSLRRKLDQSIAVIQEASSTLSALPALFAVPLATVAALILAFVEWVLVAIALGSAGKLTMDPTTDIATWTFDATLSHMEIWNILLLFWTLNVVLAVGQTVIAHAVSSYYFTHNKAHVSGVFALQAAVYTVIQFHLGSIVLGSFLIAIVQWIRVLLRAIRHQATNSKSTFATIAYQSVSCLMGVVTGVVDLLSLNAFIQIAMTGEDFLTSANRGFTQLGRNSLQFTLVQFIADLMLFFGKVCVSCLSMYIAFNLTSADTELQMFSIPVMMCLAISWTVASGVMNVYKVAIDTVFMCYCEDNDMNDGTTKPFVLPDPTRSMVSAYVEIV